jgi:F0F1-type ATP synthase membrane subunit b/b'
LHLQPLCGIIETRRNKMNNQFEDISGQWDDEVQDTQEYSEQLLDEASRLWEEELESLRTEAHEIKSNQK